MNQSHTDDLDGDFLACSPTNGAPGYEFVCFYTMRIVAWSLFIVALFAFTVAYLELMYYRSVLGTISYKPTMGAQALSVSTGNRRGTRRPTLYRARTAAIVGSGVMSVAISLMTSGSGAAFPTNTLQGQVGDLLMANYFTLAWVMSLRTVRGAERYENMIKLNGRCGSTTPQARESNASFSKLTQALNAFQGPLAPGLALGLWLLLQAGVLTRGWYLATGYIITTIFGTRGFIVVVTKRVTTVKRMAAIVRTAAGSHEVQSVRKGYMQAQVLSLATEMLSVFIAGAFSTASLVIFGSTFNSRQFIVHMAILNTMNLVVLVLSVGRMFSHIRKLSRRRAKDLIFQTATAKGNIATADSSIVLSQSIIEASPV